ncbi:hypothetical protein BOX15_Mlig007664g1 [Macrostomum lignano]|uniref:Transmembrane protein 164 n=1 Tax=Macrostomum lignano TaxID=282301 RepID=A0A267GR66_9PLAT|nr:hypothetical protein BOX15_Mlig018378g1 [Macrostomum lignano]PAA88531.1 hypothetical protein BOX15_Mlig007664g1 [Macrostomum lignano]
MRSFLEWTHSGVNFSLDGAGGPGCVNYLTWGQKAKETIPCLCVAIMQLWLGLSSVQVRHKHNANTDPRLGKTLLLLFGSAHIFVFGIEIGFKLSTGTLIWLFNPCHVITIIQITLLILPKSSLSVGLFRSMIHLLNGPLLALLLPVVNTRLLPGEVVIYYLQHVLILTVPLCMLLTGKFTTEPLLDFSWVTLSQSMQSIYHFTVLQPISSVTMVNLDSILCPAISDPFRGHHYRLWAVFHQMLQVTVQGKCLTCIYHLLLVLLVISSRYSRHQYAKLEDATTSTTNASSKKTDNLTAADYHNALSDNKTN